ncbi:MAG: electron transport complex subunit E [Candidatus Tritonobacter lacicola]|nr:electron transport complex subunit E [Candidatus Tritonobacter lacicola]
MRALREFTKGIIERNPIFVLMLGLCPALAVSTSVTDAVGMGLATTFVLVCSNVSISIIRKIIPYRVRIPCYIVVIASFVTIVKLALNAYLPDLYKSLGIFVPLIVVNCIILGRAEAFASRNGVGLSFMDGLGMGVGFGLGLVLMGFIREVIGAGELCHLRVLWKGYEPMLVMTQPPGAFLVLGFLLGLFNLLHRNLKKSKD